MTTPQINRPTTTYQLSKIQSTPMPNGLLDLVMTLPETQSRLVLLIVRETLGWSAGISGMRRAVVRITYGEIKRRIGRNASSAISAAVDDLVNRGILETLDRDGRVLATAVARQRLKAALWFRIARHHVETANVDKCVDIKRRPEHACSAN